MIDTNLGGCFNMAKAVWDGMRARSFGRIVNIGSINGQAGQYGQVNYAAAKSGIHGFTKALAQEGAAKGITVNAIAPGYIDTDMVAAVPADVLEKIVAKHSGRAAGQGRRDRARRAVPGRRRCRLHHRLDAVDQRRPAHVLIFVLEVYERVLPSRSVSLWWVSPWIALVLFGFQGVLHISRSRVLVRIAGSLNEAVSKRV